MKTLHVRGNARAFLDDIFPDMLACTSDDDPDADQLRTLARCYAGGVLRFDASDAKAVAAALCDLANSEDDDAERTRLREEHAIARIHRATRDGLTSLQLAALRASRPATV